MNIYLLVFIYVLLVIAAIFAKLQKPQFYKYTKPLPILFLIVFFSMTSFGQPHFSTWILLGLVGGLLGDILLLKDSLFIPGALAFLIGHIFYIVEFLQKPLIYDLYLFTSVAVVSVLYGLYLIRNIQRKKGLYGFVITAYIACIYSMFITSMSFYLHEPSYFLIPLGAGVFMVSDAALSYGKFIRSSNMQEFIVSVTYYSAQLFIVFGYLRIPFTA
ncbi:MAG: lysoplasmalogenase [Spirochaetota bacterium]